MTVKVITTQSPGGRGLRGGGKGASADSPSVPPIKGGKVIGVSPIKEEEIGDQ